MINTEQQPTEQRRTLTFYRFCAVDELQATQTLLTEAGERLELRGTILLAREGVNGTLVGTTSALLQMQQLLVTRFGDIPCKWSDIDPGNTGFFRYKVKLKDEIVTFGVADLDVTRTGQHVDPQTWNDLLADPEVVVIDTRNQYEIDIGTFPGAVSPHTTNFREFPQWVAQQLNPERDKKVAMFCTGGIRCEKASAYMLQQGFSEVYQLDGGILKYLESTDEENNLWDGECFVFDQRVSVDASLRQGSYQQCFACRHPVSAEDIASPTYEAGVSCPHCYGQEDKGDRQRFRERQQQIELARARGESHIGAPQKKSQHQR
ncbi:MAG: rhodanese-related sulfurtransferase [Pseudomonadales bacterium]